MTLAENLSNFNGSSSESELQNLFSNLAPAFLYGGYIQVRNDYRIYIRTVEVYFHSEKHDGIHDPIVYHRDGRDLEKAPYFPLMTLHAHTSGFDITFESESGRYRASALIRSYEVKTSDGKYLKWDGTKNLFLASSAYQYNTQSTYLYTLLNGFALDDTLGIKWIDAQRSQSTDLLIKARQNVFQSENEYEYKPTNIRCVRKWSFTRQEKV